MASDGISDEPTVSEPFRDNPVVYNLPSALLQAIAVTRDIVSKLSPAALSNDAKHSRQLQRACMEESKAWVLRLIKSMCMCVRVCVCVYENISSICVCILTLV